LTVNSLIPSSPPPTCFVEHAGDDQAHHLALVPAEGTVALRTRSTCVDSSSMLRLRSRAWPTGSSSTSSLKGLLGNCTARAASRTQVARIAALRGLVDDVEAKTDAPTPRVRGFESRVHFA
jgi:hypothetical protein